MATVGGFLLELSDGIPSSVGLGETALFLLGVYVVPVALGALSFAGFLLARLDTDDVRQEQHADFRPVGRDGVLQFLLGSCVPFLGAHAISLPSYFVIAVVVGGR